jgi:ribosome-associated protein
VNSRPPRTPAPELAETPSDGPFEADERPSKSARKRDAHALQDIGTALVALSRERLGRIPMPDKLRQAVLEAQRITKHEARRRQMQYIGKLMRDADRAPIQEALDVINGVSAAAVARQHRLERLRTRLMEDEAVLGEVVAAHPGADLQQLRQLRRNALREQEQGKPPRAFRELFRVLRDLEAPGAAADPHEFSDEDDDA